MDHREHKKWFRIISIASIVIFFIVTLFIGFIINQKFYFDTSELAIISAVVSVISVISNSFDIVLYHKSDKDIEMVSKYIHTWQKVCKFKVISFIIFVILNDILLQKEWNCISTPFQTKRTFVIVMTSLSFHRTLITTFVYHYPLTIVIWHLLLSSTFHI